MKPLVFVLLDGLKYRTARDHMGFLNHLAEQGLAGFGALQSELPSLSRPLYATILSGRKVFEHGIVSNLVTRRLDAETIFDRVRQAGGTSAAAAYSWVSELCVASPFDPLVHRDHSDPESSLQAGRFYWEDTYPDSHLFADAEVLRLRHQPDFLFIHPMNIDDAGHRHGGNSPEYARQAAMTDMMLSHLIPRWTEAGYQVVVSSDHGMNSMGFHGGTLEDERLVPFFTLSPSCKTGYVAEVREQAGLAAFLCNLLEIPAGEAMAPAIGG